MPAVANDEGTLTAFRVTAEHALRTKLGVSAVVQPMAPGTYERTEFKARRVLDERQLFREAVGQ
jgi:phenylacetate-CoA ligase